MNRFQRFSTNINHTYVRSCVDIGEANRGILTSVNRPLVGQARNILNLSLDYEKPEWGFESRALYNYTGERISDVGAFGLPDIIEHGYAHLDLLLAKGFGAEKRLRAEFQIENLLNRQIDFFDNGNGLPTPANFNGDTATMLGVKGKKIIETVPLLRSPFNKTTPDFRPQAGSPALDAANVAAGFNDQFFATANYVGAFDANNDWTLGWTKWVFGQ